MHMPNVKVEISTDRPPRGMDILDGSNGNKFTVDTGATVHCVNGHPLAGPIVIGVDNEAAIPVRLWHLAVLDSLVEVLLRDKAIVVERGHLEAIEDARIFDVRDGHAVGQDDKANKVARRLRE